MEQSSRTGRRLTRQGFLKLTGSGLAAAAFLGVAGCGDSDAGQNGDDQVTLSVWDYWGTGEVTNQAFDNLLESYMETHPNVSIERRTLPYEELREALLRGAAAGELPDIAMIAYTEHQEYAELGILEDITERVEDWGQADRYLDEPWAPTVYQGRNYGIPNSNNCLGLFYNRDLLESAGVEPPTTWEELRSAAGALTGDDHFGLVMCAYQNEEGVFHWLPFLWQSGEDLPTLDSDGGREALQLWVDMVEEGSMSRGILGWIQEEVKDEFLNGRAAMMVNGSWQIAPLREQAPDLNWGVALLPSNQESASCLGGENWCIISGSENVDAAWDLITWAQELDNLTEFLIQADRLPSREELTDDPHYTDDTERSVFVEQLEVSRARAYGPSYPEMSVAIQEAMQAAISGQSEVSDALTEAQAQITPLLPEETQ